MILIYVGSFQNLWEGSTNASGEVPDSVVHPPPFKDSSSLPDFLVLLYLILATLDELVRTHMSSTLVNLGLKQQC